MKTSVLIIAHNEEETIKECIASVLRQTMPPDEIVVICHNCTDTTVSIARAFPKVTVIEYAGPEGVPYARIKGFETVTGDIVACLDGDSTASPTWLKNLTDPLLRHHDITIVAGYVVLTNSFFARLTSIWQFVLFKKMLGLKINRFAWGSNFACRKSDYEKVGGLTPLLTLRKQLGLHYWAEDFYLSLALMQIGEIHFALNARNYTQIPEWKINLRTAPILQWREDNNALLNYFEKK